MKDFEDARAATEEMFQNDEQLSLDDAASAQETEEQPVEVPTETVGQAKQVEQQQPTQEEVMLDEAVNTAEVAAQAAQEREMQLQQALQELEAIKAQNQQMQGAIEELSKKNEENLIEEAMQMPVLDVNGLAFATEEEIAKAQNEYAQKMAEYVKGDVMKEVAPFVEQAREGQRQKEQSEMIELLAALPELQGIGDMLPQMEKIIANNRWLQSEDMPMEEKLLNAFAIAKGVNFINTPPEEPKEPTSEELMELYDKNPTFQELVEKKRLDAIKQSQQVPPFSASSGAVNAALNIKEKPQTLEEASKRTREMFGMM